MQKHINAFLEFHRQHALQPVVAIKRTLEEIVKEIISESPLAADSPHHGPDHWLRVLSNGKRILDRYFEEHLITRHSNVARNRLTAMWLFALCHDCRREDEGECIEHGHAGAQYLRYQFGGAIHSSIIDFAATACELHTIVRCPRSSPLMALNCIGGWQVEDGQGLTSAQRDFYGICMDADRLDLPRVGIRPNPYYMFDAENLQFLK